MPTFLQENRMLAWSLAGVAFLVAFLLILKIVEIAADLRRRLPRGSKSRQLRLGFVESYDLDGERQLMLVRRDNIEHLLMIGGPNDVLVESGIVRVEPREARPPRPMEALAGVAPAAPVAAPHHAPSAPERPSPPLQPAPAAEPRPAPAPLRRAPPSRLRRRARSLPSPPRPSSRLRRRASRFRLGSDRPSRSRRRRASRRRAPRRATSRRGPDSSRRPSRGA